MGEILVLAGLVGLAIALLAIPLCVILLRRRERAIAQSIREEYEL